MMAERCFGQESIEVLWSLALNRCSMLDRRLEEVPRLYCSARMIALIVSNAKTLLGCGSLICTVRSY